MEQVQRIPGLSGREVTRIHTVVSAAAAKLPIETYRNEAELDPLTALRNRRGRDADLARIQSSERSLAIASIDLDGLKRVNDTDGHDAGDAYIRQFAADLRMKTAEIGATIYRYGGDEFAVIRCPDDEDLERTLVELQEDSSVAPFSFGVAKWPDDDSDKATVIRIADLRQLENKVARKARADSPTERDC